MNEMNELHTKPHLHEQKKNLLMLNWAWTSCETGENLWLNTLTEALLKLKTDF